MISEEDNDDIFPARDKPIKLIPTKPDAELAEELKRELAEAAEPYLKAATKAKALGFNVQSNFGPDAFNRIVILQLNLIKIF